MPPTYVLVALIFGWKGALLRQEHFYKLPAIKYYKWYVNFY